MTSRADLSLATFAALHPIVISDSREIRSLLVRAQAEGATFLRGVNRQVLAEEARLVGVEDTELVFRVRNLAPAEGRRLILHFQSGVVPYFFSSMLCRDELPELVVEFPSAIYQAERRERRRASSAEGSAAPERAWLRWSGGREETRILDESPGGLGLLVHSSKRVPIREPLRIERSRAGAADTRHGQVLAESPAPGGWKRLHVATSAFPPAAPFPVEARRTATAGVSARTASPAEAEGPLAPHHSEPVSYLSARGEELRGVVDATGEARGAPAVVIPPGWGRTKETLLPLALTLVESFRRAGRPLAVLRFDGIRKRGESHNDPECRTPGSEYHRFTFTQGVDDLRSSVRFLREDPRFQSPAIGLVTFSEPSVEGRRFLALDRGRSVKGWVCVAGGTDLQTVMRVASGGIDYVRGVETGLHFGFQEVLGVVSNIDLAVRDAIDGGMAYQEDARRDFREISIPITWIHGEYDAWMDLARTRDALAHGSPAGRKLISVPTGHQLRSSREAFDVFELVTEELAPMLGEHGIVPARPASDFAEARRRAEQQRLKSEPVDLRAFWQDYILGRSHGLGFELMNQTRNYRDFMREQSDLLAPKPGDLVADLGAGACAFPLQLAEREAGALPRIIEVDLVHGALERGRKRLRSEYPSAAPSIFALQGNLAEGIPLANACCDRVLASLLLSYLPDPAGLLREMRRILKPRGVLVVSSLRRDADFSRFYSEGLGQVVAGDLDRLDQERRRDVVLEAARSFMNDATRLLDLEEQGTFSFWDAEELRAILEEQGFSVRSVQPALGDPPQVVIARATLR